MDPPPPPPISAVHKPTDDPSTSTSPGSCATKLRLMCSYGGNIVPRPHDKSLCYAGGDTRIVALDRRSTAASLSSLTAHLSRSLLNGRPFSLKYQLPHHELDSLISISTDEDLANMIDEYDRLSLSSTPARLRFFLFPVGSDLHDPKSDAWFFDALRNVRVDGKGRSMDSDLGHGVEGQGESEGKCGGELGSGSGSMPESIVLEKRSSFGSTSSSASTSNSLAIRAGGEEGGGGVMVQDQKIQLTPVDSIGSDSSIVSPNFQPQNIVYQDTIGHVDSKGNMVPASLVEAESNTSDRSPHSDVRIPVQLSGYPLSQPLDPLQQPPQPPSSATPQPLLAPPPTYLHPSSHYIQQYYSSAVPVGTYPTMYQPYLQQQQQGQYQINKSYPLYMTSVGQPHPYDVSMPAVPPTHHPNLHSNTVVFPSQMVYEGFKPTAPAPAYTSAVYMSTAMPAPPLAAAVAETPVSRPSDDRQHQFVPIPQVNAPPSRSLAMVPPVESVGYSTEFEDPMHAQIYKTQPSAPVLASQKVVLSETFTRLHVDANK